MIRNNKLNDKKESGTASSVAVQNKFSVRYCCKGHKVDREHKYVIFS